MTTRRLLRHLINAISGISLFGVILGLISRGKPAIDHSRGLIIFLNCTIPWRWASAVTFGDVVLVLSPPIRWASVAEMPPKLLDHEEKHAIQYTYTLGLPYFPLYWLACGYSWLKAGDHWSFNVFEVKAGLADGGYILQVSRGDRKRALDS